MTAPRALLAVALALAGCGDREPPAGGSGGSDVVASYRGGEVTVADVDRAVLAMPPESRQLPATDVAAWYRDLVRRIVFERVVVEEAELQGVAADEEFRARHEERRRDLIAEYYRELHAPRPQPVTEEEIRDYYDAHPEIRDREARRLVWHLFRRADAGEPIASVEREVAELRRRALAGESRARLAREHSDSESRHRDGLLGWVGRDDLPDALASEIFSLEEGVPSEPLVTPQGVHLFWVERAVEAKEFGFEETRTLAARELARQRRAEAVDRWLAETPLPPGSFVPDREELQQLVGSGDPRMVVLRVGGYELSLGRYLSLLAERLRGASAEERTADFAWRVFEDLARRERILQRFFDQAAALPPELAERLSSRRREDLLRYYRQRRLSLRLEEDPERLRRFYEDNRLRFSTPLELHLERLSVPLAAGGSEAMAKLEALRDELDDGTTSLEAVAGELDGEVEDLGWRPLPDLGRAEPRLAAAVTAVEEGGHSAPFRGRTTLQMVRVAGRRDPEPRPLAEVMNQVRGAYLESHGQELFQEWFEEVLAAVDLEIGEERLYDLAGRAAAPDPST